MPKRPLASKAVARTPPPSPEGSMGWFIIVHGVPNVGKSTFAGFSEKPYYLHDPAERGIRRLISFGEVPLEREYVQESRDWKHLLDQIDAFPQERQTLVLDGLVGYQQLAFEHVAKRDYNGKMTKKGFFNYQQGPKRVARNEWPRDLITRVVDLTHRGKDVILVTHSRIKLKKNLMGEDYPHYSPILDEDLWEATGKDAQYVFFLGWNVEVEDRRAGETMSPRVFVGPNPNYFTKSQPRINTPSIPFKSGPEVWEDLRNRLVRAENFS